MSEPKDRRPDFSRGLVHLTKERDKTSAFDVLKEILSSGKLKGSGHSGYVKGRRKAVCFSEIPIASVHHFAGKPGKKDARYRFYGVILAKNSVYRVGGRPVIYLPDNEAEWIPDEQKWRHVRFEHPAVDWTHKREWGVPGGLDLGQFPGIYLLVWTATEAREILEFDFPLKKKVRGVLPMDHLTRFL